MIYRFLVLFAMLAASPALAASDSEARLCRDLRLEPPLRVEACARALAAPDLTTREQVELLSARARALDDLGDYKRAIADYDSAIVLAPDDPVLHLNRGVAKIHDGRPTDAIADYDTAIRLKPSWHLPYFDRAVALGDLGQRAAALKDYERAIQRKPDDAWIYVGQGDVLAASGDLERALASYDKALALRADLDDPRAKRASVLLRLDRPAEALPEFDHVLATHPSKPHLWQARGEAKFQLALYADAVADFERALDLARQDGDARRALARAQLGAGDVEGAWQTMSPSFDAPRAEAADLVLGAMVAMLTNRASAADGLVHRAIDLKPGEGTAQAVLALTLQRQGDAEGARNAAELAAAFAPQDAQVAAVAKLAGAKMDDASLPRLPRTTPAKVALADCVVSLAAGDLGTARTAGPGWSLCHLAAVLTR
ncbi:tetratricopeptide repeat protein [Dongia deserti]|uniref:tetratricopeptide repeat protein n=1 Tax=Dongia deserti TaxID=2268030 RepID=UPI0013C3F83E|nr:tetratricopeptide repeat protein [Dongia deserti]